MNQRMQMLKEKWSNLGTALKITIGTVGLALIIYLLFSFFMPDRYQVLYTGLDEKDQTEIEKYLSNKGVAYQLDAETQTLKVDGNIIQLKKELALEGLPSGGSAGGGLEQFNNMSLGATKYDKDVQYQNALQDELNDSLEQMFEGISSADVKLPKPEDKSIFEDNKTSTQVSVALKLRSGYELTPEQVKAVQVYVAGAISEVKADDVQVVDSNFNLLSAADTKETSLTKQRQIVEESKKMMESELEAALSEVYGRVKVIVNMDINFDEIVRNIKKYDPEGTILSKDDTVERVRQIQGDSATVPGTDENGEVPKYEIQNVPSTDILNVQDKDRVIENFVVGETVEKIIKQPELRNANISIWFDDESLTQPDLYDAEEMVAVASGLTGEVKRVANDKAVYQNGSVKVTKKRFAEELPKEEKETEEEKGLLASIPWYAYVIGGILLVALIAGIVFMVLRRKKNKENGDDEEEFIIEQQPLDDINAAAKVETDADIERRLENETEEEIFNSLGGKFNIEWSTEQKDLRKLTNEVAKRYPKETADVISKIMKK